MTTAGPRCRGTRSCCRFLRTCLSISATDVYWTATSMLSWGTPRKVSVLPREGVHNCRRLHRTGPETARCGTWRCHPSGGRSLRLLGEHVSSAVSRWSGPRDQRHDPQGSSHKLCTGNYKQSQFGTGHCLDRNADWAHIGTGNAAHHYRGRSFAASTRRLSLPGSGQEHHLVRRN